MQFFNYKGLYIHYQYLPGKGSRHFVFANSLGTDFRIWDEVVEQLKEHGSILRFDKPGHGLSESGKSADITTYAAMVLSLMDAHQIGRCVFIGLSIGGLMGQYLTIHHPDRIEKLVLSNTAARIGEQKYWNERIGKIETGGTASLSAMIIGRWLPPHFQETQPAATAGLKRMLECCDTPGYVYACQTLRDTDFTSSLSAINIPVLCIAGSLDVAVPLQHMQALSASITGSQLYVMEGIGHLPCVETPRDFTAATLSFVLES